MLITGSVARNAIFYSLISFTVFLSGCDWFTKSPASNEQHFVLVDVLDANFYKNCSIAGAINIPFDNVVAYAQKNWNTELTYIVLFCGNYRCTASGQAAMELKKLGFKNVWAYEGGTAEWYHLGKQEAASGKSVTYKTQGPCDLEIAGYLNDFESPAGHKSNAPLITAQELKDMMEKFEKMGQFRK